MTGAFACVCMFFRWPPPKSIYLKTLTNTNYVWPLLWYAVFLSSPAIFDSWADPPPLAHSCLLDCCSWHHIQKSSSLSAVPSKKEEGHQKAFTGLSRHEHRWTFLVSQTGEWSGCMQEGRGGGSLRLPLALCVYMRQSRLRALSFSNTKSPRLKLSHWSPSSSHIPPLLPLPRVSFCAIPCHSMPCYSLPFLVGPKQTGAVCLTLTVWRDDVLYLAALSTPVDKRCSLFPLLSFLFFLTFPLSSITKHLYSSPAFCLCRQITLWMDEMVTAREMPEQHTDPKRLTIRSQSTGIVFTRDVRFLF